MIDLTLNDKDRDGFITQLFLKENTNKFIVRYASGRLKEQDFSIHNFNQTLYLMEEQFLKYREAYVKNNLRIQSKVQAKKLVEALIAILGVVVTVNMPIPEIVQGIIVGILALYTFLYQVEASHIIDYGRAGIEVVNTADKFLKMKDDFKITITDPKSGKDEEWYLVTLAGIERICGLGHLEFLSEVLTEERKNEERTETEEVLKKKMAL